MNRRQHKEARKGVERRPVCRAGWPRAALGFVLLLVLGANTAGAAAQRRPSFLFILGDNLGQDWFGCYGSDERATPHVDRLAAGGVRFEHCYTTPLCSTTRAELWTGRYGYRTGWTTHHDAAIYGGGGLDWERETTLARLLQQAGYATAITGKWQINDLYEQPDALRRHGFDEHLVWTGAIVGEGTADRRWRASLAAGEKHVLESRYWDPIVFRNGQRQELPGVFGPDVYVDYLIDFMSRHRERPFLACYATPLTHIPVVTTPGSPDASASEREQFAGMVRYLDAQVGRLVAALERLGLRDDTIVVFTTDNGTVTKLAGRAGGEPAQGGLGTLTEGGLDVPLVVNCPARVARGRVSRALVDASDFLPTLAELAGAAIPSGLALDGRSFAGQLDAAGEKPAARQWVFTQYADVRVVRDARYKLYSTGKLFDVAADPREKQELAPGAQAEANAARRRLQAVLDGLPGDHRLPFDFRSSSAFRLREQRAKPAAPKP